MICASLYLRVLSQDILMDHARKLYFLQSLPFRRGIALGRRLLPRAAWHRCLMLIVMQSPSLLGRCADALSHARNQPRRQADRGLTFVMSSVRIS